MRVLFDTNVILDQMLEREPYAATAERLMSLADSGVIEDLIGATTVTTIHYLASRALDERRASEHVRTLLDIFDVALADRDVLRDALSSGFSDYEDTVLHRAALDSGAAAIVTGNVKDFSRSEIPVFEPPALLAVVLAGVE